MRYSASFRPEARDDVDREAAYYDGEREGLGLEFIDAVFGAVDRATAFPDKHRVEIDDVRVALATPFPFGVFFYLRDESTLRVLAVADLRADPTQRRESLRGRRET